MGTEAAKPSGRHSVTRLRCPAPGLKVGKATVSLPPKTADAYYGTTDWKALRKACLERSNYRCEIVGPGCIGKASIADHILSRKAGGKDDIANLRSACRVCDNGRKEGPTGIRRSPRQE